MKILIEGWTDTYHSYALVNCFHIYHFKKLYPSVTIYRRQIPHYSSSWKLEENIYPQHIQEAIDNTPVWNGEDIDLIFRLAFPYHISRKQFDQKRYPSNIRTDKIPIIVFYTAETQSLDLQTFHPFIPQQSLLHNILQQYTNLHFVTPSKWSQRAMKPILSPTRNKVIPHGFDPQVFYPLKDRDKVVQMKRTYKIPPNRVVFLHAGAMTRSKGVENVLYILFRLSVNAKLPVHLVLKCSDSLYQSGKIIKHYFSKLRSILSVPEYYVNYFIQNHITVITDTFSCDQMNTLYNLSDIYFSPYTAEGFNLSPLEALASGCRLIITKGGCTDEYIDELTKHTNGMILTIPSRQTKTSLGTMQFINNETAAQHIFNHWEKLTDQTLYKEQKENMQTILREKFTWNNVVQQYMEYFQQINE